LTFLPRLPQTGDSCTKLCQYLYIFVLCQLFF